MNKKRIAFIVIFSIFIFNLNLVSSRAVEYELGVGENDTFIWEVEKYDEKTYAQYFSEEPDFTQGVSRKYEITNIEEKSEYWEVEYEIWEYTFDTDKFTEDPDDEESKKIYQSPSDQAEKIYTIDDLLDLWMVPTPLTNYLESFRDDFENEIINLYVDDNGVLTAKYAFSNIEYEIKIAYTLDGVIETIEYITMDGDKFVKINLYRETIRGDLLLLIPIIGITCFTLIYIVMKKKHLIRIKLA